MKFRKRRVLVVGGRGFIGSHLPVGVVYDLEDGNDVRRGIAGKWDTIVFLAANMGRDKLAYNYNRQLYVALDHYMQDHPETHVIYTSSAAIYPDVKKAQSEKDVPEPVNYYGLAKLRGESFVQQYKRHTILRLSNVYGKGGHGAINLFMKGHKTIYGSGKSVRDYVSVERVVKCIKEAISNPKKWQGITNVSSGIPKTTNQIYKMYGIHKKDKHAKERPGDVQYSLLDCTKMERLLWDK